MFSGGGDCPWCAGGLEGYGVTALPGMPALRGICSRLVASQSTSIIQDCTVRLVFVWIGLTLFFLFFQVVLSLLRLMRALASLTSFSTQRKRLQATVLPARATVVHRALKSATESTPSQNVITQVSTTLCNRYVFLTHLLFPLLSANDENEWSQTIVSTFVPVAYYTTLKLAGCCA